ncbi:hypothetical protein CPAV1605_542 [seawater metagenome]|uniref:Uncharacterized protein n=1 Tax=seawater metagenome TaxID=1561972 RepID=A0A5E8CIC0_9ZZZZ
MNENIIKLILQHIENNKNKKSIYQEDILLNENRLNIKIHQNSILDSHTLIKLLYVVKFNKAEFNPVNNTLVLPYNNNSIIEFEDRPGRNFRFIDHKSFSELWIDKSHNSFVNIPPNAVLYENNRLVMIVIKNAYLSNNNIVLEIETEQLLPLKLKDGAIFIDNKEIESEIPNEIEIKEKKKLCCSICKNNKFYTQKSMLRKGRVASYFNLEWLFDDKAIIYICSECSHIHWFKSKDKFLFK